MNDKTEWLLFGWIGGLGCIIWALINAFKYGFWVDGVFNYTPIVLIIVGIVIIIFTMGVYKHGDW